MIVGSIEGGHLKINKGGGGRQRKVVVMGGRADGRTMPTDDGERSNMFPLSNAVHVQSPKMRTCGTKIIGGIGSPRVDVWEFLLLDVGCFNGRER